MAEPIGALRAELSASAAQFEKDMGAARRSVQNSASRMQQSFRALGRGANRAYQEIFSVRTAAAAAAGAAGLFALSKQAIATADNVAKTARAVGVTGEQLQELRFAAERSGVSAGELDNNMIQFTKRLGEARTGTGEAKDALEQLGISLDAIKGKSPVEVLDMVADALLKVEDPLDRNAILADLFGRSGVKMATMLAQGAAGIDDLRAAARRLGLVIDEDMLTKAEQANDELDDMQKVLKMGATVIGLEFMPAMRELAGTITDGTFQTGLRGFVGEMKDVIGWMVRNKDVILRVLGAFIGMRVLSAFGTKGAIAGAVAGAAGPEIMQFLEFLTGKATAAATGAPSEAPLDDDTRYDFDPVGRTGPAAFEATNTAAEEAAKAIKTVGDGIDSLGSQFEQAEDMISASGSAIASGLSGAFAQWTQGAEVNVKDMARSILADLASMYAQIVANKLLAGLLGGGVLPGAVPQFTTTVKRAVPIPGFAEGGSFEVGGAGGRDSQRVTMDLTPGEIVNVSKGDQRGASNVQIVQHLTFNDVTPGIMAKIEQRLAREAERMPDLVMSAQRRRRANDPYAYEPQR